MKKIIGIFIVFISIYGNCYGEFVKINSEFGYSESQEDCRTYTFKDRITDETKEKIKNNPDIIFESVYSANMHSVVIYKNPFFEWETVENIIQILEIWQNWTATATVEDAVGYNNSWFSEKSYEIGRDENGNYFLIDTDRNLRIDLLDILK